MKLSDFGRQLTGDSGIVTLMEDLGDALNVNPDILFLGGGNPARIPEFEALIAEELKQIADDPNRLNKLVGVYQSPQGAEDFLDALVAFYRKEMGWNISRKNIALSNGSQSAFFVLLNLLAGTDAAGARHVCFPMMPEYLGYADQCVSPGLIYGFRPQIEQLNNRQFKYHVDFRALNLKPGTAAISVSRPTNPTGNILQSDEIEHLHKLAVAADIPLVVDCAYGDPFPGVCYEQVKTLWHDNMILVQSLSKLGLPGARTGIVVANEEVISRFVKANTIMCLANGNFGPGIMSSIVASGRLPGIKNQILLPFYRARRQAMLSCIERRFSGLDYRIHVSEGAFFVWLWFPSLPIASAELYQRCKQRGLLIMPGEPFFFGLESPWSHAEQCIRLTFCQSESVIESAIDILAQELESLV